MVHHINILLVENDEDDYIILQEILSKIGSFRTELTWADNFKKACLLIEEKSFDIFIVDYRLGGHTGLDLLSHVKKKKLVKPFIILANQSNYNIDMKAMKEGASDYIEKNHLNSHILERAIRYAIGRSKTLERLYQSKRKLHLLSEKLLDSQETERKRISKDLHDSIGASLAAIKFGLETQMYSNGPKDEKEKSLQNLISLVKNTITETQRLYINLRPRILDDLGIIMTIKWFCRLYQNIYSDIAIKTHLAIDEKVITDPLKIIIYRILQEALNNVAKHSGASVTEITLEEKNSLINFIVKDNGNGFTEDLLFNEKKESASGVGLLSIKERVTFSGGELTIFPGKGEGTIIHAMWPVHAIT